MAYPEIVTKLIEVGQDEYRKTLWLWVVTPTEISVFFLSTQ